MPKSSIFNSWSAILFSSFARKDEEKQTSGLWVKQTPFSLGTLAALPLRLAEIAWDTWVTWPGHEHENNIARTNPSIKILTTKYHWSWSWNTFRSTRLGGAMAHAKIPKSAQLPYQVLHDHSCFGTLKLSWPLPKEVTNLLETSTNARTPGEPCIFDVQLQQLGERTHNDFAGRRHMDLAKTSKRNVGYKSKKTQVWQSGILNSDTAAKNQQNHLTWRHGSRYISNMRIKSQISDRKTRDTEPYIYMLPPPMYPRFSSNAVVGWLYRDLEIQSSHP